MLASCVSVFLFVKRCGSNFASTLLSCFHRSVMPMNKGMWRGGEVWKQFAQTLFAQTFFSVLDGN